ncbi:E3 ubiquitin protein ligase DRIP2 [Prunus yedoensis var. nudiflora]|uniref:E3 ubiquitin protein ligase DRIP2 n=1 Tax=Prunus yedoensis var. nudiflora TaxID=2094558 RepID=A0A314YRY9_PRUYE|nr:E3 ubiquitin protein ligase DRIP2 [Prunus yedoensis var. nudiflora]
MPMMSSQVVKRERAKLEACMTCPLCNKLFSEATTISECLHTFCRKCIYKKIIDEEVDYCPKCKADLGVSPLEKLRADNNWEDIRAKLFPSDRKKVKAAADHNVQGIMEKTFPSETKEFKAPADRNVQDITPKLFPSEREQVKAPSVSGVTLPAKRKERYLSSLVISTPRVSSSSEMSGRRRYPTRRSFTLRGSLSIQEPEKKEEDFLERLNSSGTLKKDAVYTRQNSTEGSSKQHMVNKDVEDNAQPGDGRANLWKPLNRLVEDASNTSADKLPVQLPASESVLQVLPDNLNKERREIKAIPEHDNISKVHGNENESNPAPSGSMTFRKAARGRKRKPAASQGLNISAQYVIDANNKCERRFRPIWFSLIASNHQDGYAPLPQIPSCYLRVKDGNLPVSFIKKYLVKNLELTSEDEVEISLLGKPVIPTLQLQNLVDLWLRTTPASQIIQTSPGSSAKEYVMALTYGRNMQLR